MILETPAIGSTVHGKRAHAEALRRFFTTSPDYEVTLERHISGGMTMFCWEPRG